MDIWILLFMIVFFIGVVHVIQILATTFIGTIPWVAFPKRLGLLLKWIKKNPSWTLDDALRFLAEEIEGTMKADLAVFYIFDKDEYKFAVSSRPGVSAPYEKNQEVPGEVLSIKTSKKPRFWTQSFKELLSESSYAYFKDFKAFIGIPLSTKDGFLGVLMLYYRDREQFGPLERGLIHFATGDISLITREAILDKGNLELVRPDVLRLQVQLPSTVKVDTYFNETGETLKAISFIYLMYRLFASGDSLRTFIQTFGDTDPAILETSMLTRYWPRASTESLRIRSIHYGSPASFDLLGIGKILSRSRKVL